MEVKGHPDSEFCYRVSSSAPSTLVAGYRVCQNPPHSGMGSTHVDVSYRDMQLLPTWRNSVYQSIHLWLLCCTSWCSDYRMTLTPSLLPQLITGVHHYPQPFGSVLSIRTSTRMTRRVIVTPAMGLGLLWDFLCFVIYLLLLSTVLVPQNSSRITGAVCFNIF